MRASKPSNEIKNQVADKNLLWQSMSSARESHYSDRRFFCNTFFETFALTNHAIFLCCDHTQTSLNFTSQTSLIRGDIWSHHALLDVEIMIKITVIEDQNHCEFLGKLTTNQITKICSPSVGAKTSEWFPSDPQLIETRVLWSLSRRIFCEVFFGRSSGGPTSNNRSATRRITQLLSTKDFFLRR